MIDATEARRLMAIIDEDNFDCMAGPLRNRREWQSLKEYVAGDGNYQVEDGWLELHSGTKFEFRAPTSEMFKLDDVAIALGRICRYNGHTLQHYSVAEHSVLLAKHLAAQYSLEDRRENAAVRTLIRTVLFHDVAEFVMADLPRPIKYALPGYKEIERGIEEAAARRFDLFYPFPDVVRELDSRVIQDERAQAMNASGHDWGTDRLVPLGVTLQFWSADRAAYEFRHMALYVGAS